MIETRRKTILVWRDEVRKLVPISGSLNCLWCNAELLVTSPLDPADDYDLPSFSRDYRSKMRGTEIYRSYCPLCGWGQRAERFSDSFFQASGTLFLGGDDLVITSVLKGFDIDSPSLALAELGTHLKNNFSDVYGLDPWRFEEVMNDVFRAHGYRTILTQRRKDGGADIVLLGKDDGSVAGIVECKRYAKNRKIGVELVKQLMGTVIEWKLRRAYFVTTSDFTLGAREVAENYLQQGYEFDLIAASSILKMLDIYNEKLPPLDKLSDALRTEIIAANRMSRPTW